MYFFSFVLRACVRACVRAGGRVGRWCVPFLWRITRVLKVAVNERRTSPPAASPPAIADRRTQPLSPTVPMRVHERPCSCRCAFVCARVCACVRARACVCVHVCTRACTCAVRARVHACMRGVRAHIGAANTKQTEVVGGRGPGCRAHRCSASQVPTLLSADIM